MTENEIREMVQSLRNRLETFASSGWAIDGLINDYTKSADTIEKLLDELEQYRAIGTVEELQALKEKNEPKRLLTREEKYPQNYGIYSTSDRWCPCCRGLVFTGDWSVYKQNIMYKRIRCGCGQKLDWSE